MNHRCVVLASILLMLAAGEAQAKHDVRAFVSTKGIRFIEGALPELLNNDYPIPTIRKSFACMDFEQRNSIVDVNFSDVQITIPAAGRIRVKFSVEAHGEGEIHADDLYACIGSATCDDTLDLVGSATLEYRVAVESGRARVSLYDLDMDLGPNDISLRFSGCGFTGNALNTAISFGKEWLLDLVVSKVDGLARGKLADRLSNLLSGLGYSGTAGIADFAVGIRDLDLAISGLGVNLDVDLYDPYAPDQCVASYDSGAPTDLEGTVPNLSAMVKSSVAVGANLGLINHIFYVFWRRGLMCLTGSDLQQLGLDVDLEEVAIMLPGFPTGTTFSLELMLTSPPRIAGAVSIGDYDPEVSVAIDGITVDLHGDRPDGTRNTLHATLDVEATARVAIDGATNALVVKPVDARIKRMLVEDERKATGDGYDVARILTFVHEGILPDVLEEVGEIPVTGPVVSLAGYAVILRELETTQSYLSAGVDLFELPENDTQAPNTTIVNSPSSVVSPHDALVLVSGSDSEIPDELLKYRVTVNGVAREPTFLRQHKIGESGKTDSYQVTIAALDMAGNEDPSPASTTLTVDGILPLVHLAGERYTDGSNGPVEVSWSLSDDTTATDQLKVRVDILDVEDPTDLLSAKLIESHDLAKGATNFAVETKGAGIYRVEVHVEDAAGNDSVASMLVTVESSGCSAGGRSQLAGLGLLLLAIAFSAGRRRQLR